ncbi:uncharacterized protein [Diabrotica undecimpunctata]|uniref:uncharacterized protein n=1 Tax=Diabrotica undecimpunctata TaxID=50387 RepID=UPI003B63BB8D
MPSKPAKYGIKVMCMADAKRSYFYNGYIYSRRDSDGVGLSEEELKLFKPAQCVIRLSKPIEGSNRNNTADNYFSSIELVTELQKRHLTYVGKVKKNKRELPLEFQANKSREIGTTLYGF